MTMSAPSPARPLALKRTLLIGCALADLGGMAGTAHGQAFNGTPTTAFGNVTYDRATPLVETVRINTPTAVIDWRAASPNFLPAGNVATFQNGINTTDFVVLNRILFGQPVRFDGSVLSVLIDAVGNAQTGGTVIFSAPNGLIVGSTGVFDVGSLVLTTLNVNVDGAGNFYDPATRGITLSAGPSPLAGATVVTEGGAQLNAPQPNSYVALIGQVVQHAGATRVNGSAAYVAGEQVQFRANQGLFDIIVTTGSANAQPLLHTGSTGGPASTGPGDNQAIYLVAMPKNQAITAVLQGDIGFDPAVAVGVENGEIVLSAGANVVGGTVDRYGHVTGTPAPDQAANFEINGGVVHSDLTGVARTNMRARPLGTPLLTFEQDASLFGGSIASMSVTSGQVINVLGNAIVSTAAFDTFLPGLVNLAGGQAGIFTVDGGTIHISGTATVDASARGLVAAGGNAGSGTGGTAAVNAAGGTITIDGALNILATGEGGVSAAVPANNGGAGIGGTATLNAQAGGAANANSSVGMNANGTASASGAATQNGAPGTGGTINVTGSGGGNVAIAGIYVGSANGAGGDVPAGTGLSGGAGTGGTINVRATDGNIDFNANASFLAAGGGGLGPLGGAGQGGNLNIEATRGTIDFVGQTSGAAGGFGGDAVVPGGPGGTGQGGKILIAAHSSDAPSRITGGALSLATAGQGGRGGNGLIATPAGTGGAGTGGTISILAESANGTIVLGPLKLAADGLGGDGGGFDGATGGATGGAGNGGRLLIGTEGGVAPGGGGAPTGSATFATADLSARGTGGTGGLGTGAGGIGTGGIAGVTATGAPTRVTGPTTLVAEGRGGLGGPSAVGPGVGTTGQGRGGTVNLAAAAHPVTNAPGMVTLAAVIGSANALGGPTGNSAGSWHVGAAGGGSVSATGMTLTAAANGTGIGVPAASSLDPQNGTINVTGTAQLGTDGDIQVNAAQAGRVAGGRYELNAGRDVTFGHASPPPAGLTLDSNELFVVAGRNFTAATGVVTRTAGQTDIRATGNATIAGRIEGGNILLRSAGLDVTATGAIGTTGTGTTDIAATGAATVAGQITGVNVVLNAASLDLAGPGTIGTAGSTLVANVQTTGDTSIAGQVRGQAITLRSAGLTVAAGGAVGGAGTTSVDAQATGNASVAGQILGTNIILRSAALDVGATGTIGGAATASADVRATGDATVAGQIRGQAITLRSAGLTLTAGAAVGGAGTASVDAQATGNATIAGQVLGTNIILRSAALDVAATGTIGAATSASTDVRATGNANIAGQILGQAIVLRSAGLNVAGAVGGAGTASVDAQATGNANIAGQVLATNIVLRSAGLDVAATGVIGSAASTSTDVRATGNANLAGQILGQAITLRSAGLTLAAGSGVGGAGTASVDAQATGNATIAGQVLGANIVLRSAALDVGATGTIGAAATASADVRATGNANIAGQILGQAIVLRSAGLTIAGTGAVGAGGTNSADILATGAASVAGQVRGTGILLDAASLNLAATGTIGGGAATNVSEIRTAGNAAIAGQVTGATVRVTSAAINVAPGGQVGGAATNVAELRAAGLLTVGGRLLGADILAASSDIDLPAAGAIGDPATQIVRLAPNATGQTATLGGTAQGPGYTLTAAEAGRIRGGTLRVDAPAVAGGNALLVRDLTFTGGGAAAGIGTLQLNTPGVARVEGNLLLTGARAQDGIAIAATQRLEVVTPTASVRVRDGAGAPGGTLSLASNNIWVASDAILTLLRADPNYAGRDDDLIDNDGNDAPRGYVEGNGVTLTANGTLYVQNTTAARGTFVSGSDFGGVTTGAGGLTVVAGAPNTNVYAFGRRLNPDGTFTTGDTYFFQSTYNRSAGANYTPTAAVNTCIIVTGACPLRVPPDTGVDGPDPITGPTDGSTAILLSQNDEDDVIDSSFAADPLIEEPVTSGSEPDLWNCDPDHDGDCDDQPR